MNGTIGVGYFDRAIEVALKSLSACKYISQNACKVVTNKTQFSDEGQRTAPSMCHQVPSTFGLTQGLSLTWNFTTQKASWP